MRAQPGQPQLYKLSYDVETKKNDTKLLILDKPLAKTFNAKVFDSQN